MKMITIPCELKLECNLRTRGIKGSSSPLPNFKFRNGNVGLWKSSILCPLVYARGHAFNLTLQDTQHRAIHIHMHVL